MLGRLIRHTLAKLFSKKSDNTYLNERTFESQANHAIQLLNEGKRQDCIDLLQPLHIADPENVIILNQLGCAYGEIGQRKLAEEFFIKAYTLDERCIAAILNHARLLMENRDNTAAFEVLKLGKLAEPDSPGVANTYASYLFAEGRVTESHPHLLQAWVDSFDTLRAANAYLFGCAYDHAMSEATLAQEHFFWAATLPSTTALSTVSQSSSEIDSTLKKKIRLAYLSPDLRLHSVAYFFRPLLRHHDTSIFEIFILDDTVLKDDGTKSILSDNTVIYYDTSSLSNEEITARILSLKLDILIELSGHTSHNRMDIFTHRLASIQMNALGYPPTTGLITIDYKFSDKWIHHESDHQYYAEKPLVLPNSFWCFDPIDHIPHSPNIPFDKNRYITFGCQGNIAKISDELLNAWSRILKQTDNSQLILRALNFKDSGVKSRFLKRLLAHGIPENRITLLPPATALEFFSSFDEIDITLDTYPFNGGTTTAFSLYMGTPVVSLFGEALPSRMGLSMLSNLDLEDLATDHIESYIQIAISLSKDKDRLRSIKQSLRGKFQASPLGNGEIYTRELESKLLQILKSPQQAITYAELPALPAKELVKRGYLVIANNNQDAANRIADYCLSHYPTYGPAHVLYSTRFTSTGDAPAAYAYLLAALHTVDSESKIPVFINLLRLSLLVNTPLEEIAKILDLARNIISSDEVDQLQLQTLKIACELRRSSLPPVTAPYPNSITNTVHVVIVTDDDDHYPKTRSTIEGNWDPLSLKNCTFSRVHFNDRHQKLKKIASEADADDIIIYLASPAIPLSRHTITLLSQSLSQCDILSHMGSRQFDRPNWEHSEFANREGSFIAISEGRSEMYLTGHPRAIVTNNMKVLSGAFLSFKAKVLRKWPMNENLGRGALTMEEYWTSSVASDGGLLGVHYLLDVVLLGVNPPLTDNLTSARNKIAEWLNWDPFPSPPDDLVVVTAPVPNFETASHIIHHLLSNSPQPAQNIQ